MFSTLRSNLFSRAPAAGPTPPRPRWGGRAWVGALLLAAGAGPAAAQRPPRLTAQVSNLQAGRGTCYLALFAAAGAAAFPKHAARAVRTLRVAAAGPTCRVSFEGLPPGSYALAVYQDENDNDRLDTNFLRIPTERYGFSNQAHGLLGPPSFKAAQFVVAATDTVVAVRLR